MRYLFEMNKLTTAALFFLAVGIFTSVSILSGYQILFAIPLLYYTLMAFKNKNYRVPKSAWFLLAFMGIALISLLVNYDLLPKPGKNFGRLKYYLFGFGGIFVLRVWLKETNDKTKLFLTNTFLVAIAVAGAYATYTFFTNGEGRARGFTDTLRYGYGSGMLLLTLLGCVLHREKIQSWFNWRLGIFALILGFSGLWFTYTRGALLGFLCGLPFVLYYYKRTLGLTLGGLAFLGVLGLGTVYLFGSGNYNSRFLMSKNNASDNIRRSQWKAAIIATKEKPFLGYGLSNYHSQLNRIKHQYDLDAKHYNDAHSHNLFLEVASGTGLIGLFFFLGWVLSWAWEVFREGKLIRALIIPFGVAFVASSQFEVTFDANNASMIFFIYALSSCFTLDADRTV